MVEQIDAWLAASPSSSLPFPAFEASDEDQTTRKLSRGDALRILKRRLAPAGTASVFINYSFKAAGITELVVKDGNSQTVQELANHAGAKPETSIIGDESRMEREKTLGLVNEKSSPFKNFNWEASFDTNHNHTAKSLESRCSVSLHKEELGVI